MRMRKGGGLGGQQQATASAAAIMTASSRPLTVLFADQGEHAAEDLVR